MDTKLRHLIAWQQRWSRLAQTVKSKCCKPQCSLRRVKSFPSADGSSLPELAAADGASARAEQAVGLARWMKTISQQKLQGTGRSCFPILPGAGGLRNRCQSVAARVTVLAVSLRYKRSLCTKHNIRNTHILPCSLMLHIVIGELLQGRLPFLSQECSFRGFSVRVCMPMHTCCIRGDTTAWVEPLVPLLMGGVGEGFSLLFPLLVLVVEAVGFCCGNSCKLPNTSGRYCLDPSLLTKTRVFFKVRFKLLQLEERRMNVKIALWCAKQCFV